MQVARLTIHRRAWRARGTGAPLYLTAFIGVWLVLRWVWDFGQSMAAHHSTTRELWRLLPESWLLALLVVASVIVFRHRRHQSAEPAD